MKIIKHYIKHSLLIKLASLNSLSVSIRIFSGFLTSKFIAIFVGTEGLALIGNLRDFVSSIQAFSTLGMYSGVIKYVAEFKKDVKKISETLSTVFYLGLIATGVISLTCFFGAQYLSELIFKQENNYAYIIKILGVALPFYALNLLLLSIINGLSKFKKLIKFNIFGQLFGAIITLLLIGLKQLEGALIAVATVESFLFFITLIGVKNRKSIFDSITRHNFNFQSVKNLSTYSGMTLFSALMIPLITFAVRSYIIDAIGAEEAGIWEAMNRISKYYLMFVTTLISLYILPRFVEINTPREFKKEVLSFYKSIIPVFGLGLVIIYFLRHLIIKILLSDEFMATEELFLWQLLGDFIKVLSFVIAYEFLAKKMFWQYIITEAISVIVLYSSSIYLIDIYGVKGANMAHLVTYILYFGVVLFILRKKIFISDKKVI